MPKTKLKLKQLKPTVFFVEGREGLLHKIEVTFIREGEPGRTWLEVRWNEDRQAAVDLGDFDCGEHTCAAYIPEIAEAQEIAATIRGAESGEGAENGEDAESGKGGEDGEGGEDTRRVWWKPVRRWEVHMVPITHHDHGYTDTIEEIYENYNEYYDRVLQYCAETDHLPDDAKYRYTVEQTWSLVHYLRNRPRETVDRFMQYAAAGRIEIAATFGNMIDAMCGHEELHRLLYPSFQLRRTYGIPVTTANMVDIPGMSWGLSAVLGQAGVRYLFAGLPTYFEWQNWRVPSFWDEAKIMPNGRPGAFYWETPDRRRILTYYSGGYGFMPGVPNSGPNTLQEIADNLPAALEELERGGSPFSVVRYIDKGVDNYPPQKTISYIANEWNARYAYPKLIVSTNRMFFERLELQCADIPVFRGELPHTDYNVGALIAAKESALNRSTHHHLQAAEHVAVLDTLFAGGSYPAAALDRAYREMMLYDEHTFGMWQPLGKLMDWNWNIKSGFAHRAAAYAQKALVKGADHLAARIRCSEAGTYLTVFNPLGMDRSAPVQVANFPYRAGTFDLIDLDSGGKVPYQITEIDDPALPRPHASGRYALGRAGSDGTGTTMADYLYTLVFLGERLPAMGYKTYRLAEREEREQAADAAMGAEMPPQAEGVLENAFYSIRYDADTGALIGITDKELERELVDPAGEFGFHQVVVRCVDRGTTSGIQPRKLVKRTDGDVFSSLVMEGAAPGCPRFTQEIVLYHGVKKIDFATRMLKDETPFQEVYIAFPYAVEQPRFRFEGVHSVIEPFADQFPGSNTNYYTVQNWAQVRGEGVNVVLTPIDSHILEFGGIWPSRVSHAHHGMPPAGYELPPIDGGKITNGHMYAFVFDSNFRTNFAPVQSADMLFRFSMTSNRETEANPFRFGWSCCMPTVPVLAKRQAGPADQTRQAGQTGHAEQAGQAGQVQAALPGALRFAAADRETVFISGMKQAEDERGLILRFLEMEGKSAEVRVALPHLRIRRAYQTSNVEENLRLLPFTEREIVFSIAPYECVTIRVESDEVYRGAFVEDFHQRLASNRSIFLS